MRTTWTGCGTALVTPFTRDGAVDEAGVRRLARRQIDAGIHFLVPCGTTGESPTLIETNGSASSQLVVEEAAGRVPVLAGAGGYDTREVIQSRARMKQRRRRRHPLGDAVLQQADARKASSSTTARLRARSGCRSSSTTCPGRTGCNVEVATLVRLSAVPDIVGVKEASGNISQMCRGLRRRAERLPRPLGRRCADAAADGGRRARDDLGGRQRGAARDGAHGRAARSAAISPARAPDPRAAAAADDGELHRIQSRSRSRARWPRWACSKRSIACRWCHRARPRGGGSAHVLADAAGSTRMAGATSDDDGDAASGDRERSSRPAADRRNRPVTAFAAAAGARSPTAASAPPNRIRRRRRGWRVNAWVKQGILLGFRSARSSTVLGGSRTLAVLRQGHAAAEDAGRRRRRAHRPWRIDGPRRRLPRPRRHLHAADVHQHRRLRRRRDAGRLARARRLVRADRQRACT